MLLYTKYSFRGAEVSRFIEEPLVAFGCCQLYGQAVVSLTHYTFPSSILPIAYSIRKIDQITKTNLKPLNHENEVKVT